MPLLERDDELAELELAIGDASAGSGRLVAIEAQAGLGKTHLLRAARDTGDAAGLETLTARGTELERDFPFALVRQMFEPRLLAMPAEERDALFDGADAARTAFGLDGSGAEASRDGVSVLHGLYWMTAALAERSPVLLAIDDAHWSDAASLDYLSFLLPRLEELPVLVVVACRPDRQNGASGLTRIVADSSVRRLEPRALSTSAAAALLAAELGSPPDPEFAATCHEVSGGNPFLLCELARTLVAEEIRPRANQAELVRELTPERVGHTVLLRLTRLSPDAGAVARALAVLGDGSDHRLVTELAGIDPHAAAEAADTLRGAAILSPDRSLRFAHPLIRNAVYSDLPAGARGAAHARAASLLRERGGNPDRIVAQLVVSEPGGERETAEALLGAGTDALARGAPRSAIAYLTRALHEPSPEDLRAAVLDSLLTASLRATDLATYMAIESELFAELERAPELGIRWATRLTVWLALTGRFDRAIEVLKAAIETALERDDMDSAFALEAQLGTIARLPADQAQARLARYRDRIELDSPSGRLFAAIESYWSAHWGTAAEAAELANHALRDGLIFAEQLEVVAPGLAVYVLLLADDFEGAQRGAEHALSIARQRDATPELASARCLTATVKWAYGDLASAEADARQAVELARLGGLAIMAPLFLALLIDILIERGELDVAEAELEAIGMADVIPDTIVLQALLFERGRLRLVQGKPKQAAEDFIELQRRREDAGVASNPLLQAGPYTARALMALGDVDGAREWGERDLAHARRWGGAATLSRALRAVSTTVDDTTRLEMLEEAAAILEDSPARLARAYALTDLGAALRRDNRRADARQPLKEALDLARRCGAATLAKRAHDELQATGEQVRRYVPIGVESLTPSERRVAELAATGMTNREVAQTLFLTVKTIETHLSAAYDKLGIRSRRQLPEALSDAPSRGPDPDGGPDRAPA